MAVEKKAKLSLKVLSKTATRSIVKSSNTTCCCWQSQSKESEKIKKLRKF